MWKYIIHDNFLEKKHFELLCSYEQMFETEPDEIDISKHKVYHNSNGKQNVIKGNYFRKFGTPSATPGNELITNYRQLLPNDLVMELFNTYDDRLRNALKYLAPERLKRHNMSEISLTNTGKNYSYDLHTDSKDKLLSVVVYLTPEQNVGTTLYNNQDINSAEQLQWKQNRAFLFARNEETWHSYKANNISNRLTLVYALRTA